MCEETLLPDPAIPELERRYMEDKLRKDMLKKFVGKPYSPKVMHDMEVYLLGRLQSVLDLDGEFPWHVDIQEKDEGWHWVLENTSVHRREEGNAKDVPACADAVLKALKYMRICR